MSDVRARRRTPSGRRIEAAILAVLAFLGLGGLPALHELHHDPRTHVHDGEVVRPSSAGPRAEAGPPHRREPPASGDEDRELPGSSSGVDHPEPWDPGHGAHSALHGRLALVAAPPPPAPEPVEPLWQRPPPRYTAPLAVQRFRLPVVAQGPPPA